MSAQIFKNSYIVFLISFISLCIVVYMFGIGQVKTIEIDDEKKPKIVDKFNWKYPLAISLMIWAFWHYYMYPPQDEFDIEPIVAPPKQFGGLTQRGYAYGQKINMINWN